MPARLTSSRGLGVAILATLVLAVAFGVPWRPVDALQSSPLVRGNAPGEWRYWGADAWSTRYSPLDQINASNFEKLQVAWQWNAGPFGQDEYLPDDAALRQWQAVYRRNHSTHSRRARSGDGRDPLDVAAE